MECPECGDELVHCKKSECWYCPTCDEYFDEKDLRRKRAEKYEKDNVKIGHSNKST